MADDYVFNLDGVASILLLIYTLDSQLTKRSMKKLIL